MTDTKLYIFTIPKAGTYFLAELMSRLGWVDSGLHIAEDHYLDNKRQPMAIAASLALSTEHQRPYYQSLEQVRAGQLCFGHMNPMLFFRPHPGDFAVLGCRRRLRDVLAAFKTKDLPAPEVLLASVNADLKRLEGMQSMGGAFGFWMP